MASPLPLAMGQIWRLDSDRAELDTHGHNGAVDRIRFLLTDDSLRGFPKVRIEVNGRDLVDIVAAVERPFVDHDGGSPDLAGSYSGYTAAQFDESPASHFLGSSSSHLDCGPHDKTALLDCECGCPGCWTLMARVTKSDTEVTWTDFEQVHRDWSYKLSFTFDREQYESALAHLAAAC
jgi:hypothetical protein